MDLAPDNIFHVAPMQENTFSDLIFFSQDAFW